jgi:hypothetical protein
MNRRAPSPTPTPAPTAMSHKPAAVAASQPAPDLRPAPLARATSMSQRRLALNIPTLQRRISFTPTFNLAKKADSTESTTPYTPVDQIMHTPTVPPKLSPIITSRASYYVSRLSPSSDSPGISPDVYPFFKFNLSKAALSRRLSYNRGIPSPTLHVATAFARPSSDLQSPALIPSHPCTPTAEPTTPGSGCTTPVVRSHA